MGKSCVRFTSADDLDLDLIAETIASFAVDDHVDLDRLAPAFLSRRRHAQPLNVTTAPTAAALIPMKAAHTPILDQVPETSSPINSRTHAIRLTRKINGTEAIPLKTAVNTAYGSMPTGS